MLSYYFSSYLFLLSLSNIHFCVASNYEWDINQFVETKTFGTHSSHLVRLQSRHKHRIKKKEESFINKQKNVVEQNQKKSRKKIKGCDSKSKSNLRQTSASSSSLDDDDDDDDNEDENSKNQNQNKTSSGTDYLGGIISLTSACGQANPNSKISQDSGPNGSQEFFNCGITSSTGWNPANVKMKMLKFITLENKLAKSTFSSCEKFIPLFEKYGEKFDVPAIFLASFAMQESSCRPDVRGDNGGAYGLMQITQDKCGQAPDGDCADPDYNVMMGAKTFADGLSAADGNVLVALGAYNGWTKGLTKSKALAAIDQGCCECQQNLDYLQQFLNGWILGVNPNTHRLGAVHNLDACKS